MLSSSLSKKWPSQGVSLITENGVGTGELAFIHHRDNPARVTGGVAEGGWNTQQGFGGTGDPQRPRHADSSQHRVVGQLRAGALPGPHEVVGDTASLTLSGKSFSVTVHPDLC